MEGKVRLHGRFQALPWLEGLPALCRRGGQNTNVFVMEEFETAEHAHEFLGLDYQWEAPRSGIMLAVERVTRWAH